MKERLKKKKNPPIRQPSSKQQPPQKPLPPSPISPFLMLSMTLHSVGHPLANLDQLSWLCPLPAYGRFHRCTASVKPSTWCRFIHKKRVSSNPAWPSMLWYELKGFAYGFNIFNDWHRWRLRKGDEHEMGAAHLTKGRRLCASYLQPPLQAVVPKEVPTANSAGWLEGLRSPP